MLIRLIFTCLTYQSLSLEIFYMYRPLMIVVSEFSTLELNALGDISLC